LMNWHAKPGTNNLPLLSVLAFRAISLGNETVMMYGNCPNWWAHGLNANGRVYEMKRIVELRHHPP